VEKANFPVAVLCRVLQVSRSSYYAYIRRPAQTPKDAARSKLVDKVVNIHKATRKSYGSRRMARQLQEQGHAVGRYQARSLMR